MLDNEESERLQRLRQEAANVAGILRRQARRPFIVEITGTPKAGKTTLITMVDGFLRDASWRVHVLTERAGACPLPMKGHFLFNTWTTGTMLAGLIDAVDRDVDLVVLDRGVFDALIWLEIQRAHGQVSEEERSAFEVFVMLPRWRRLTDLTCTISVEPEVSMLRENGRRLLPRSGSVMNEPFLVEFNQTLNELTQRYRGGFNFVQLENAGSPKQGAEALVGQILERARVFADPEIAVIPQHRAAELVPDRIVQWSDETWSALVRDVTFQKRSSVENDDHWVQVLACGAQISAGEMFVSIRRRRQLTQSSSHRDDTALVWQGCHVEKPAHQSLAVTDLVSQLRERLCADLHLSDLNSTPEPLGLVWIPNGPEPRHLGVMFKVPLEQRIAKFLDEKEFRTNGRGYNRRSSFMAEAELAAGGAGAKGYTLEQWSEEILKAKWLP